MKKRQRAEYFKQYHKAHKDKDILYRQTHKKEKAIYDKQYQKTRKPKNAEKDKRYRKAHKKEIAKRLKQYRDNHKEERREYRKNNKEKIAEGYKQWAKSPKGRASTKARDHKRAMLLKDLTTQMVQLVYENNIKRYGTLTCVLCGKPIEFGDDSLEHLTPLSRGGTNDYENLGVAHLMCNLEKHTMTLGEWVLSRQAVILYGLGVG